MVSPRQLSRQRQLAAHEIARSAAAFRRNRQRIEFDRAFDWLRTALDVVVDRAPAKFGGKRNHHRLQACRPTPRAPARLRSQLRSCRRRRKISPAWPGSLISTPSDCRSDQQCIDRCPAPTAGDILVGRLHVAIAQERVEFPGGFHRKSYSIAAPAIGQGLTQRREAQRRSSAKIEPQRTQRSQSCWPLLICFVSFVSFVVSENLCAFAPLREIQFAFYGHLLIAPVAECLPAESLPNPAGC